MWSNFNEFLCFHINTENTFVPKIKKLRRTWTCEHSVMMAYMRPLNLNLHRTVQKKANIVIIAVDQSESCRCICTIPCSEHGSEQSDARFRADPPERIQRSPVTTDRRILNSFIILIRSQHFLIVVAFINLLFRKFETIRFATEIRKVLKNKF